MADFLNKLPSILVLAVLVGIFVALRRHVRSSRLNLWTAAWLLIFIHFFIEIFEPRTGNLGNFIYMIDGGTLQVSAMLFVASLTSFVEDKKKTWMLLGSLVFFGITVYIVVCVLSPYLILPYHLSVNTDIQFSLYLY